MRIPWRGRSHQGVRTPPEAGPYGAETGKLKLSPNPCSPWTTGRRTPVWGSYRPRRRMRGPVAGTVSRLLVHQKLAGLPGAGGGRIAQIRGRPVGLGHLCAGGVVHMHENLMGRQQGLQNLPMEFQSNPVVGRIDRIDSQIIAAKQDVGAKLHRRIQHDLRGGGVETAHPAHDVDPALGASTVSWIRRPISARPPGDSHR